MRPQTHSPASCIATFSRRLLDSSESSSSAAGVIGDAAQVIRRIVALGLVSLLLVSMLPGQLFAQQSPYNGQYAPYPQSGYGQPAYAPPNYPQPYPQQQPNAQSYPQQPYQRQFYAPSDQVYSQQGYGQAQPMAQPLNAQQLEQLVAPIALYPDTLVAQVLTAATYPAQVADADHWRQAQGYAYPDQIAGGADVQPWDPSIKAMTAFPQVLAEMDQNLPWTTALGNAYYNQPQDIFQAVQIMRQRAQSAGNLQNTPQEAVSYNQGNIELAPVNPQMIYVPAYNPWTVYGQPISPYPGFSLLGALGSFFGSSPVRFGLGIAMAAFTHMSWGWLGWGLNWLAQAVLFHQSNYYSRSTTVADWGLPHGGPRAFSQHGGMSMLTSNSYRNPGGYGRQVGGYNGTATHGFARTPDRSAYSGYNRSYQTPGNGYARPSQEAYNRIQPVRPQQYGRPTYGSTFNSYNRPGESYTSRPATAYGGSMQQAYRAPAAGVQRGDYGQRSSGAFMGRGFAAANAKPPHSGGFHPFGGGHAPKGYGSAKSFRGHSGGGGHGGGRGGGKHHFL
jgi:hypothetical protein